MGDKQPVDDQVVSASTGMDEGDDHLARRVKALGHPARLALVRALSSQPCCCGHLVRDLSGRHVMLAQSTVSQHLGILVDAGLVERQRCGVEQLYSLNRSALDATMRDLALLSNDTHLDAS